MRALRDFNIPKIVTDDLPVFMGLIGDLFPALDVPRKRDLNFEKVGPGGPSGPARRGRGGGWWVSRRHLHGRCDGGARGSLCHERPPGATNGLPARGGDPLSMLGAGSPRGPERASGRSVPRRGAQENHRQGENERANTATPGASLTVPPARQEVPLPPGPPGPRAQHPALCAPPQIIKQSVVELKLQAEDSFVLKVVQLEELLQVRHSVFVIGNAGSGKSQARRPPPPPPSPRATLAGPRRLPTPLGQPQPLSWVLLSSCSFPLDTSHLALCGQCPTPTLLFPPAPLCKPPTFLSPPPPV